LNSATGEVVQLSKNAKVIKSTQCSGNFPSGIFAGLGIVLVGMMVSWTLIFKKVRKLQQQELEENEGEKRQMEFE